MVVGSVLLVRRVYLITFSENSPEEQRRKRGYQVRGVSSVSVENSHIESSVVKVLIGETYRGVMLSLFESEK